MRVLGIETSCDETAVAAVEAEGTFERGFSFRVLGEALYSQTEIHAPYGGVYPTLAKREHVKNLVPLLERALEEAKVLKAPHEENLRARDVEKMLEREPELYRSLVAFLGRHGKPSIDAIAVTYGPGLPPALWVGVNFARALSLLWDIPLVGVNHLEGHIMIAAMQGNKLAPLEFPLLTLLVSGGHTELALSPRFMEYEMLGETRDDAAGEAFDKVARMLGLPYPGGPEIARLAAKARTGGNEPVVRFPRPMLTQDNFDFSFAGLKTEVRKYLGTRELSEEARAEVARAFEDAVVDTLIGKTVRAAEEYGAGGVVCGGGVSANQELRKRLSEALQEIGTALFVPPPELSTDNALMIALAGYFHARGGDFADPRSLSADGNLKLGKDPYSVLR